MLLAVGRVPTEQDCAVVEMGEHRQSADRVTGRDDDPDPPAAVQVELAVLGRQVESRRQGTPGRSMSTRGTRPD